MMYREVVESSGYFYAPKTKCDASGGNRAHQAAVHLRRSVPESNVRALRVQDGRSREDRTVLMARSTPNFHGPQVRVLQRACTPRFMDVFRDILECITYGPPYVSDGVNHHISTTRLVSLSHNTSATSTCLSPRGLTISGCPAFKQLKTVTRTTTRSGEEGSITSVNRFYQCGYFMSITKCGLEPATQLVS